MNLPVGLGTHVHWDRKLDGRLAQAIMSIHSVKGVEIGNAFENARKLGTDVQDEIFIRDGKVVRETNRAGGLEGGLTNGEPLVIRAAFKPIATTLTPTNSIDVTTRAAAMMIYQRSDLVHIPRACVITESMVCLILADAMMEKFGGDSLREMRAHFDAWNPTLPEISRP